MDDGPGGSAHGFERALDELGAALDQDLYGDSTVPIVAACRPDGPNPG